MKSVLTLIFLFLYIIVLPPEMVGYGIELGLVDWFGDGSDRKDVNMGFSIVWMIVNMCAFIAWKIYKLPKTK